MLACKPVAVSAVNLAAKHQQAPLISADLQASHDWSPSQHARVGQLFLDVLNDLAVFFRMLNL